MPPPPGSTIFCDKEMAAEEGLEVALARLDLLESRLAAVTAEEAAGPAGGATSASDIKIALATYQAQLIPRLLDIKAAMQAGGGDVVTVTNERNALQAENAKLKEEMSRLRYRVNHLVKELNAMEAA